MRPCFRAILVTRSASFTSTNVSVFRVRCILWARSAARTMTVIAPSSRTSASIEVISPRNSLTGISPVTSTSRSLPSWKKLFESAPFAPKTGIGRLGPLARALPSLIRIAQLSGSATSWSTVTSMIVDMISESSGVFPMLIFSKALIDGIDENQECHGMYRRMPGRNLRGSSIWL